MRRAALLLLALAALAAPLLGAGTAAGAEYDKYEVQSASASLSSTQAGAHADLTVAFSLSEDEGEPYALTRDISVSLPPGMIGNPQGFPRCSTLQLGTTPEVSECPIDSQVGITELVLGGGNAGTVNEPVYNMVPPGGDVVARLGFFAGPYPTILDVSVDPVDYGLIASIKGAPAAASFISAATTLWGVPADSSHDSSRITPIEGENGTPPPGGGRESSLPPAPFMTNPTSCTTARQISVTAASYQLPGSPSTKTGPFPQITGCGKLGFQPSLSVTPTSTEAAAATGIDALLEIPQDETPQGLGTAQLKSATVTLPPGLTINPAAGDGLAACSPAEVGFQSAAAPRCPDAAKIGSAEIDVPALERVLHGAVYQRTPEPGHLFRFWLVTDEQGVRLKLPAEIIANPLTGQLQTVFAGIPALGGNPQVSFSSLALHISGGPRAPLATPSACGTYQTHYELAPWSGGPAASGDTAMQITSGCAKGGFAPRIAAGTLEPFAGRYSPFVFELTREDGEANPQSLTVTLPEGLLGRLAGIPLCPEAQAASGACSPASQIGTASVAAGVGGAPLWIPQPGKPPTAVYLAGPYKGAPYSLVVVVPAQAGPFDLGTVVTRATIELDPRTAQITIASDPLPQILEGVPVLYRAIRVDASRPDFTLNPTDCSPAQVQAQVSAANGALASPAAGYQATNCAKLGFKPKLKLSLKGGTRRGGHPALHGVYRPRRGDSNLKRLVLRLPHSAFLDQAHIRTICTRVQYAANGGNGAGCPKASVYGHAKAWTPLLDEPLSGPVYLRSSNHNLPDFVASLHGLVDVEAVARIDSVKGGIRATFTGVPDAPLSRVAVNMQGARKGLIVNSTDLCRKKHRAAAAYAAHNARRATGRPLLRAASCSKAQRKKHRRHRANDRRQP